MPTAHDMGEVLLTMISLKQLTEKNFSGMPVYGVLEIW
jgi:hypothetical protein